MKTVNQRNIVQHQNLGRKAFLHPEYPFLNSDYRDTYVIFLLKKSSSASLSKVILSLENI